MQCFRQIKHKKTSSIHKYTEDSTQVDRTQQTVQSIQYTHHNIYYKVMKARGTKRHRKRERERERERGRESDSKE